MLHLIFAESQRLLRSPKFVSKERFASPTSNGAALCFGTTGADAQRVNVVQKLRKKARHRFFEENRGLFLPGSSRIGTPLPKNRDHPQYILQTLPIQKSDLISFISFWFWHLSTLSEKLQLKENDGLFFFGVGAQLFQNKRVPHLEQRLGKAADPAGPMGVRNPKETVAILATKEKTSSFVVYNGYIPKKTPWLSDSWRNSDVLGWFCSIIPLLAFRVPVVRGDGRQPEICVLPGWAWLLKSLTVLCWLVVSMISTSPPTTPGRGFSTFTEDLCFFSERSVRTACCGIVEVPFSWFVDKNRFMHGVHPILKNILCFTWFSLKASDF